MCKGNANLEPKGMSEILHWMPLKVYFAAAKRKSMDYERELNRVAVSQSAPEF